MSASKRSYTAGHFMLSLDGEPSVIKDFDGGNVKGEVGTIKMGPENVDMKTITTLKYEPFTINVGMSMGKSLYEWIRASLDKAHIYKSGYVAAADYNYKAMAYRHFQDALITEFTVPALDATSKDTGHFTVKFDPVSIQHAPGDDADIKGQVSNKQKVWQPSSFRVRIGNLPCTRISKVDSFTVKQGIVEDAVGEFRTYDKIPSKLEFPNLKITLSSVDAKDWYDWHKDFCIDGNCGADKELTGAIEFLAPNGKDVLGSIDLFGVGIFSATTEKLEAGKDGRSNTVVELYVEKMMLNLSHVG